MTAAMPRGGRAPVVALGVALLLALVALLLTWQHGRGLAEADELATAEREATQVASDIAVSMTTYDHRTLAEDFAWVEEDGTDGFEETFRASTRPIRGLIRKTRASAEGLVTDAAGTARDAEHVTVLLFVDQTIERPGEREPTGESTRVVMEMRKQGGRWLVDDVQLR